MSAAEVVQLPARPALVDGASFVLDQPAEVPAVIGSGTRVLMAAGESLMIVGPQGSGKTTVAQQLTLARLGLRDQVLGFPVVPGRRRVLYMACDRPRQAARSLGRMVSEADRTRLAEQLVVWQGPPPVDFGRNSDAMWALCREANADTLVVDSIKDVALRLSEDETGGTYNRGRQLALLHGVQIVELHHPRKANGENRKPTGLDDIYGSTWITSGAGSVIGLWGAPGDPYVEMVHIKQPAEDCGPLRLLHDHITGTTTVDHGVDPLALLQSRPGLTVAELAAATVADANTPPGRNDVEKARRRLDSLVAGGLARKEQAPDRGAGGKPAARYYLAERFHQEAL